MKKKRNAVPAAILLAFLFLGGLAIWLTLNFSDAIFTDGEPDQAGSFSFQTEPQSHRPDGNGQMAESASGRDTDQSEGLTETSIHDSMKQNGIVTSSMASVPEHFYIWVGDSRTLGMMRAVKDDCLYIGAAGEGYDWFIASGESEMRDAIAAHPDAPVILNLGVNDYDNMERYLERYRSIVSELSDTEFYFLSVNPIDPAVNKAITNEQIADFNAHLKELFPDSYIDGFTFLMVNEVVPIDGIHYDKETYRMLHDFVVQSLENPD